MATHSDRPSLNKDNTSKVDHQENLKTQAQPDEEVALTKGRSSKDDESKPKAEDANSATPKAKSKEDAPETPAERSDRVRGVTATKDDETQPVDDTRQDSLIVAAHNQGRV